MRTLKKTTESELAESIIREHDMEDRRDWDIISIDPKNSKDFDDAFGIKELDNKFMVSIYIANVSFWLEALGLWNSFSQRVSTIYLPNGKKPMLPPILSDTLCSLQENKTRFALTLDIIVNKETWAIEKSSFKNTCIIIRKNLRYDTDEQRNDKTFKKALCYVKRMNVVNGYIDEVLNSHDVIAYLMILMNYISAVYLKEKKIGIFRCAKFNADFIAPNVAAPVRKFLKMWNSSGGQYVKYDKFERHDMLQLDAYVHITSPIRRLPDLLNSMVIQDSLGLMKLEGERLIFYDKWMESVDYINQTMRSIRKVQNDCNLLSLCTDNSILERIHEGFIFSKTEHKDMHRYMVYFPELKMVNRFTSSYNKDNLSSHNFRFYIFMDESQLKQKIRIELQIV